MEIILRLIGPFISILLGFIIVFIGFYIKSTKKIELLSQFNQTKRYDRGELAKFAGKNLALMGLLIIISGIINIIVFVLVKSMVYFSYSMVLYFVSLLFFSFKIALGIKKFEI